ncbi:DNA cytosine methyltransferase [Lactiplantibacillus pentosus]|nr:MULTISPECIES: DNA cytosine methyltransferase [Lactiplantibacillus]MBU7446517.1 DNA cytosine methyltransferase [Lactiplantibacillus plantarum]MBU7459564.1 DNA cytosine methyltransferase [Lactiplantibacillus plantarum]MDY1546493.1 DNA cytosine methyltransferase [Lactiplantibacillus pentosus]
MPDEEKLSKFKRLKNGFRTEKISKTGYSYKYGMGAINFPDPLDKPARTMVTTEHTVSRMIHVVSDPGNGRLRLISPEEAELINTFPEGWTKLEGVSDSERYFTMGNALVVNLVKEIGIEISKIISNESEKSEFRSGRKIDYITH